ncbi:hypothetical protein [Streptomyces hainanensis]|uniref:Roadblock/LAMTOR2 domain-containing protein n=1 Tax=Streptomyces hainanensis TaxID=402648 RepID=A0A4R4T226_9ACTN|nr:hypothetical protein [Streptomyces hainanensis]TDC68453.1 hypothetical protein E1283_27385 [Streptomyces hainanensis]
MRTLDTSLSEILSLPGVLGAALVDAVTGLTYGAVGEWEGTGGGIELSDLTGLLAERLNQAGATGELESVIITSRRRHHVTQVVERRGDAVLLTTVLDRERTNLALAMRQIAERAGEVLA